MATKHALVRNVDLWSLFKVAFVIYAALGFVVGLCYGLVIAMVGSLGALWGQEVPGLGALSGAIGIVAVPVLALVYGIMGAVVVSIGGALYNLSVRWVGGLKLAVDVVESPSPPVHAAGPPPA
jgi:hypothetical protein